MVSEQIAILRLAQTHAGVGVKRGLFFIFYPKPGLILVVECGHLGRKMVIGAVNRPHEVFWAGISPAKNAAGSQ
jgi:hypothetical protein